MFPSEIQDLGQELLLDSVNFLKSDSSEFEVPCPHLAQSLAASTEHEVDLVLNGLKVRGFQTVPKEIIFIETQLVTETQLHHGELSIPGGSYKNVWDYVNVINQLCQELFTFKKIGDADGPRLMLKASHNVQHKIFKVRFSRGLWEKLGFVCLDGQLDHVQVSLTSEVVANCPLSRPDTTAQDLTIRRDVTLPAATSGGVNIVKAASQPNLCATLGEISVLVRESKPHGETRHHLLAKIHLMQDFWTDRITSNKLESFPAGTFDQRVVSLKMHPDAIYTFTLRDADDKSLRLIEGFKRIICDMSARVRN